MANPMLLKVTSSGLYCEAGDFFVDPWQPVQRAVVTHAHGDHARRDSASYLTTQAGQRVLRTRMGASSKIQAIPYGEAVIINGVRVSLHPAGHILGSAQVRVEHQGEVVVVSGDYKTEADATCATFDIQRCHTFITESTFGLPIYRWQPQIEVFQKINDWWRANQADGKCSILYGYALGKAQRLLAGVDPSIGPIYTHGAVERLNQDYRASGIPLPPTTYVADALTPRGKADWKGSLVIAPPSAHGTPWMRKFGAVSTGFASGWMQIRGKRRQRAVDRGFVFSDHADWTGLIETIKATGAEHVWVTHGYTAVMARWLREQGYDAYIVETRFNDDLEDADVEQLEPEGGV